MNTVPRRAFRVGSTQSNMSTPRATASIRSTGCPTPIRYRGLDFGNSAQSRSTISSPSVRPSPTHSPPSANPSNGMAPSRSKQRARSRASVPPCTMPNSAIRPHPSSRSRARSSRPRSAQRTVRSTATRTASAGAGSSTSSSSDIAMSVPRASWIPIAASGVSSLRLPSRCDLNSTPSSVTLRNGDRLITWNPPLSVRIAPGQLIRPWSPPIRRTVSAPGRSER